ncbi:DUF2889 domain-containing protein [Marinomonas gallaica]|uniref:DUF2889 domain-containing protein n=1 Tax=Marinomonas gallaica TaxID=1806667 RepID=UPI0008316BEB|nr:DUF2889 domain-containing protein [Marinomonas gallaica]
MIVKRTPLHTRNISINGFKREDDLWEVEGVLQDTKGYPFSLDDRGVIEVGEYLHQMILTLVFDDTFTICDVRAQMHDTPYLDCSGAAPQYERLIGLQIKKGWMTEAKEVLGRTTSCTHLTEMLPALATAALQTVRGYKLNFEPNYASGSEERSAVRNTCHGFRDGGRAQRRLWPDTAE